MIAHISGRLIQKKPAHAVVEAGGVGYLLFISLQTYYVLPEEGAAVSLHVHTSVREDAINLFGFISAREREVFEKLIGVNKVGPKMAITILSGMPCEEFANAVQNRDVARLSLIPGIGRKTAERLIVELADKLSAADFAPVGGSGVSGGTSALNNDTVEALISLGYGRAEAVRAAREAFNGKSGGRAVDSVQDGIREALKLLSAGK
ncbi:MAG: Holliday junction branch migration protein RuvA [Nitrospinae bacterium]|nr:Holliday junction branch migration protein RuvA [Nitrospinota bacterium]